MCGVGGCVCRLAGLVELTPITRLARPVWTTYSARPARRRSYRASDIGRYRLANDAITQRTERQKDRTTHVAKGPTQWRIQLAKHSSRVVGLEILGHLSRVH